MRKTRTSFLAFVALLLVTSVAAAFQGAKFPGGTYKAYDGQNNIALSFDSGGSLTAYVNNEAFSSGSWEAKGDTLAFGPLQGPEGYGCAAGARYTWSIAQTTLTVKVVADDCEIRKQYFTGLTWTKG